MSGPEVLVSRVRSSAFVSWVRYLTADDVPAGIWGGRTQAKPPAGAHCEIGAPAEMLKVLTVVAKYTVEPGGGGP
ncbi:hypothetical protein [Nocardia sp. R6R-6]|uniref:hypothetical protein n=1 Tax=Nocardia sp. R6R-6 TaxID=3459303 RepID=UPI00403DE5B4